MTDTPYTTYLIGDIRVHARGGPPNLRAMVERYHYLCRVIEPEQAWRVTKSTHAHTRTFGPKSGPKRKRVVARDEYGPAEWDDVTEVAEALGVSTGYVRECLSKDRPCRGRRLVYAIR